MARPVRPRAGLAGARVFPPGRRRATLAVARVRHGLEHRAVRGGRGTRPALAVRGVADRSARALAARALEGGPGWARAIATGRVARGAGVAGLLPARGAAPLLRQPDAVAGR